jgi:hypothetical protein
MKKPLVIKLNLPTWNYERKQAGEPSQRGIFLYILEKSPRLDLRETKYGLELHVIHISIIKWLELRSYVLKRHTYGLKLHRYQLILGAFNGFIIFMRLYTIAVKPWIEDLIIHPSYFPWQP